ncbi:MAG TPA: hypothetical protein VMZ52_11150, partial [Bryobacteraceae bacterium]|nr:hypothetical protein [Bryobacteraceae bacterium]
MIQAFRVFVFLGTCILFSSVAAGQPLINTNGVVNAASFAGTPAGGAVPLIAPGSIFSIFGKALGPATGVSASALPLPVSLPASNGTSVRVTSGNTTVNAYIFYSSATQINAILPSTASVGSATVTVSFGGQTSDPQKIWIVPSSFGVFTKNRAGFGPAIVQNFVSPSNTPVNGLATAAKSGQTVILYGTGLGAIAGPDNVAPGAVSAGPGTVEINVAGKTIRPVYAGRSPEYPGLDQINFVLESPPTGCYIPLQVRAGNSVSNITTISVAS